MSYDNSYPEIRVGNWYEPDWVSASELDQGPETTEEILIDKISDLIKEVLSERNVSVPRAVSEQIIKVIEDNDISFFKTPEFSELHSSTRFEDESSEPVDAYVGKVYDCQDDVFMDSEDAIEKGRHLLAAGYKAEWLKLENDY